MIRVALARAVQRHGAREGTIAACGALKWALGYSSPLNERENDKKEKLMPIGKVKWYDLERGFGFVSNPGEEDCFLPKSVLPEGIDDLYPGQRIEFDFVAGRKGPQVLRMEVLDPPKYKVHKYSADQLGSMVADLVTLLETTVQPGLAAGRYPEKKVGRQVAEILRVVATELDA